MKKILLLAIVAVLGFGNLFAQAPRGGRAPMSVDDRVDRLKKELVLTDEQADKVKAIMKEGMEQFKNRDRKEMSREDMRAYREEENKKIEEVLTDEQKAAYKKMQEEARKRFGQQRGRR